jgi:hypothetical protein
MASAGYMNGRRKYSRPQAVLWSNNEGTLVDGLYTPLGLEYGTLTDSEDLTEINQFLILSDHNRSPISMTSQRIEQRQRTINGRMRSYHVSDKLSISMSWTMLPSRRYSEYALFDPITGLSDKKNTQEEYTVDGGAGGVDLLEWYENHQGPFFMFLAYDKYTNLIGEDMFNKLQMYNQVIEVYFSEFSYTIEKRGGNNHDLWNVNVTLEEA